MAAIPSAVSVPEAFLARTATGFNGNRRVPTPVNETVKSYAPASPERAALKDRLRSMSNEQIEIPLIIGGKEVRTGNLADTVMPHNHRHVLARWHRASDAADPSVDFTVRVAAETRIGHPGGC